MTSVTYESHQLSLEIIQHDVDRYVEIIVKNENFTASRRSCAVKLAISVSLYLLYFITITPESMRWLHHSVFLTAMAVFGYRLLNLVENETVKIVRNLGIEMSTRYLVRRNATFIPWSNISGIVINEVIYFNRVIFVLQLLTAKEWYSEKQLLVMFDNLLPPLDCLERIYKKSYKIMER